MSAPWMAQSACAPLLLCAALLAAGAAWGAEDEPQEPSAQQTGDESPAEADDNAAEEGPKVIELEARQPPAVAPPPRRRVVDEIVVTAQKREQGLSEVPISISAFDGTFLSDNAIIDFRDLSQYVPNARIDPNGVLPQISIRGFNAAPLNRSFEQAITMVIDGVTYGTSLYFQTPLYDIGRVEVLRGPQGTLFGKNSTAGTFNIVTAPADTADWTARLSAQHGELGRRRVEAAFGGELIPGLANFRLSGLHDQRDGLLRNTTAEILPQISPDNNARDRNAGRLKIRFPDLLGVQLDLSAEYLDSLVVGAGAEIKRAAPELLPIYRAYDPQFDDTPDNWVTSIDGDEFFRIDGPTYVLNAERALGGWDLTAVAGHSGLRYSALSDPDFSPAPMLEVEYGEYHPQNTLELRTVSPAFSGLPGLAGLAGSSRLTTGVFWQHRRMTDAFSLVRVDPVAAGLLLGTNDAGPPPLLPPPGGPGLVGNPAVNNREDDEVGVIYFDQSTRSLAGFGQLEWTFLPDLTLQLGMRYSVDDKRGRWDSVFEQSEGVILSAALGREEYQARRERSEASFTPKILFQYQLNPASNVYLGWVKGFRGGGFNAFASTTSDLEYEEENVQSLEAGAKLRLLGGAATLNLGLFWMVLEDFQVLTQDPNTAVFTVVNAGRARARGLELDGVWVPTDWFTLQANLGVNDSEFLEFPFGSCTADNEDTDGDGDPRCDLAGEPLDFVSLVTGSVNPRVNWPLGAGVWEIVAGLNLLYDSEYYADVAVRDPRVKEPGSLRVNANLGLRHTRHGLSLRLVGQNLTDQSVALFTSDVPTVAGTFYQNLDPPRLLFIEFGWEF